MISMKRKKMKKNKNQIILMKVLQATIRDRKITLLLKISSNSKISNSSNRDQSEEESTKCRIPEIED
jgi:hypothetical protein